MDAARFDALVTSLEELARRDPDALRRRIKGLIALGYVYVLGILTIVIGLIAFLVYLAITSTMVGLLWKLIAVFGFLAYVILRALWVRIEPPEGRRITREQAPRLFARTEEIRKALKAPKPDVVLLSPEFNASVSQVPRFGVLGGERTYLVIGLPLMYALGPHHLDAVLGHEFGHLSGAHPKYGLWVTRVAVVWANLLAQLEASQSRFTKVFNWFAKWYVPRLNAHGHALRRDDEFAADADGASTTSPTITAQALASIAVRTSSYTEFWALTHKRMEREPEPPPHTWTTFPAFLQRSESVPVQREWLATALKQENLVDDSHPALRYRLLALESLKEPNADPAVLMHELVPPVATSAATHYLGDLATAQLAAWDREWHVFNDEAWRKTHAELRQSRVEVDALVARDAAGDRLTTDELWTVASGIERLDGETAAIPWLERVVDADEKHAAAHFALGKVLLAGLDGAGEPLMKRAMALEPAAIHGGNELLRRFHASVGDRDAILRTAVESDAHFERLRKLEEERGWMRPKDKLAPATLTAEDRRVLEKAVRDPGIAALWVARKVTTIHTETPLLVVLVEPKHRRFTFDMSERTRLAEKVLGVISSDTRPVLVLIWDANVAWLRSRFYAGSGMRITKTGTESLKPHPWYRAHWVSIVSVVGIVLTIAFIVWLVRTY